MLYFAYGSNMCTGRLLARVPSAAFVCTAQLRNHMFYFHKRSADGSGKGNALNTGDPADVVRGVIFRVDPREKHVLDRAEGIGHGYVGMPITVADEVGDQYQTFMYVADEKSIDNSLRPYSWYKRLVVEGARQYGLPADYIARIEAMPATEDPDAEFSVL